jgi:hypothetical protein
VILELLLISLIREVLSSGLLCIANGVAQEV